MLILNGPLKDRLGGSFPTEADVINEVSKDMFTIKSTTCFLQTLHFPY